MTTTSGGGEIEISAEMEAAASAAGAQIIIEKVDQCYLTPIYSKLFSSAWNLHAFLSFTSLLALFLKIFQLLASVLIYFPYSQHNRVLSIDIYQCSLISDRDIHAYKNSHC